MRINSYYKNNNQFYLFMKTKLQNRIPLSNLYQHLDQYIPTKRIIKISHQKLPKDFFPQRSKIICESMQQEVRPNLLSQNFKRNYSNIQSNRFTPKRESMTARQLRSDVKQQDLIFGIISATRQLKKVMRKHSVQLRFIQIVLINFRYFIVLLINHCETIDLWTYGFQKSMAHTYTTYQEKQFAFSIIIWLINEKKKFRYAQFIIFVKFSIVNKKENKQMTANLVMEKIRIKNNIGIELPPLIMKKGITTAF